MFRLQLEQYICETYNTNADCPWSKYPDYKVFRHTNNKKWFALIMDVPKEKLGLTGDGTLAVVNLKCGSIMAGSLRNEKGFFPAYHMNKDNWISVALDGSVPDDKIKLLLDISYDETDVKARNRKTAD